MQRKNKDGQVVSNKDKALADLQDLILTLIQKGKQLDTDSVLKNLWIQKNQKVQRAIKLLTPIERGELDRKYSEWIRQVMPQAATTHTENSEKNQKNP